MYDMTHICDTYVAKKYLVLHTSFMQLSNNSGLSQISFSTSLNKCSCSKCFLMSKNAKMDCHKQTSGIQAKICGKNVLFQLSIWLYTYFILSHYVYVCSFHLVSLESFSWHLSDNFWQVWPILYSANIILFCLSPNTP